MALFWKGMPCALCQKVVGEHDDTVATSAFIDSPFDVLWRLSDAVVHRACFVGWPYREAFVARYNEVVDRRHSDEHSLRANYMDTAGRIGSEVVPDRSLTTSRIYQALPLSSSERRPGIHVWFDPYQYPAPGARYLILLHAEGAAATLWDAVADHARVGPLPTIRESVSTGAPPPMPLNRLAAPPADLLRACPESGHDRVCLETTGHRGPRQRVANKPENCFALCLFGPLAQARPSFWAIRAKED
jgi:hypothetical protein